MLRGLWILAACALVTAQAVAFPADVIREVAWAAVDHFPPAMARQVHKHEQRYEAGIARGLQSPPAWRAARPGQLENALAHDLEMARDGILRPIPLADLVELLGVLAVRLIDANDPLAVTHDDPREPRYAAAWSSYSRAAIPRVRLVFYGYDADLVRRGHDAIDTVLERSQSLYSYVGEEFHRTGQLRNWRELDDRSVAFGVLAVSLSHGLTDLASLAAHIWKIGGGELPRPEVQRAQPTYYVLSGGFGRTPEAAASSGKRSSQP